MWQHLPVSQNTKRTAVLVLASQLTLKNVLANAPLTFTRKPTSPLKNVLANAPLTFTHKSTYSQERTFKCTLDFDSQVTSLLTSSHSGRLATVVQLSRCGAVILLLRAWYCSQVPHILLRGTPTVGRVLLSSWHCSSSATAYWCHTPCWTGCPNGLGSTLPYFFSGASSLLNWASLLPSGATFNKNILYTFCHCVKITQFSDTSTKNKQVHLILCHLI